MKKILPAFFVLILFINILPQREDDPKTHLQLDTNAVLQPEHYHNKINQVVTSLLLHHHYEKSKLNDSLSEIIFNNYIESLDRNKLYFLKSDIERFNEHRQMIDDYLTIGKLDFAYDVFNTFKQRLNERMVFIINRLEEEFDYSIDESVVLDRKDESWVESESELDETWRKRLKNDALNKKLSGEEWEKTSASLKKRYQNYHKAILQFNSEDVFQLYLNAFAMAIDPHSSYFSPISAENFNISMSRSLEGIGAQLRNVDDYTTIVEVIPGGPADKSKQIFANDRIVGVGQDDAGEMVDVIGWRTDDVVQLIRGKKGTVVRLEILSANDPYDAPTKIVTLVRDKIKLEDQSAKSDIIYLKEGEANYKLGVVSIPAFYIDFKAKNKGEADYKSTTGDVRKLLYELQQEKVDGIIIDLRNNGGGSLQEAIELTGLFIENGPVVQVKDARGIIEVGTDPDPSIAYSGPLAVLVNEFSASASEIFSGAVQDYNRGVIIGENTFGKGTVQNLIDLERVLPIQKEKLGDLKLTIAKYYRITGSSTQKKGVVPDIEFPSEVSADEHGEASYPSSLEWDQINPTTYSLYDDLNKYLPGLLNKHNERLAGNLEFQFINEDIEEYRANKNKKSYSLKEDVRKAEREKSDARSKIREEERQKKANLKIVKKSEVETEESKVDDPYLEETGRILADLIAMKVG